MSKDSFLKLLGKEKITYAIIYSGKFIKIGGGNVSKKET
jgi:hypothetical protein